MTCRVCDMCYKLVMTENQLEEVSLLRLLNDPQLQKSIGLCMNIPIPSEEEFDKKINIDHEYEEIKEITQWRIIFFI